MKAWLLILSAAALTACPALAAAPDLSKIDRTIGKEPAYQSKPKYCLVVFGPGAKTRVWLVLDGEVLYADRNGDGDLTAKDERFTKEYQTDGPVFHVGTIPAHDGGDQFSLEVHVKPAIESKDTSYVLWCRTKGGKGFRQRTDGVFRFGDTPKEAPVVHFGGPLTLTILDWHNPLQPRRLLRGNNNLSILVGTPVFGGQHETFATVYWQRFDELPTVEAAFPGKEPGAKPIVTRAVMGY